MPGRRGRLLSLSRCSDLAHSEWCPVRVCVPIPQVGHGLARPVDFSTTLCLPFRVALEVGECVLWLAARVQGRVEPRTYPSRQPNGSLLEAVSQTGAPHHMSRFTYLRRLGQFQLRDLIGHPLALTDRESSC